jgi:anti-anti-sigma regulatory factor
LLRITQIGESPSLTTLKVEGRVVSDWVSVLEEESLRWLQEKQAIVLDFSNVSLVDRRGVEVLRRLRSSNVRIINCSPLIEDLLNGKER